MAPNDTPLDTEALRAWLGRQEEDTDLLAVRHARLMAATVGREGEPLAAGDALPPLWHWLYFLTAQPAARLGRDGHPERGGFLPPVPLSNRMWAGGRVRFERPLRLGEAVRRRSTLQSIETKRGRSGDLVFVTVAHELHGADGALAIHEEQDLVFRDPPPAGRAAPPPGTTPMPVPEHSTVWRPDSTQLFRYSALTFNGHRIHYDADYAREVEGYAGLVVHGPLSATMLAALAQRHLGRDLARFAYRGQRPAIAGQPLGLHACRDGDGLVLWTTLPDGAVSMRAEAA